MNADEDRWPEVKTSTQVGDIVSCLVTGHRPFGILVMIERFPIWGVIERIRMQRDGYQTPDDYPPIGSIVSAIVLGFRDHSQQVELVLPKRDGKIG